jgi:hypothetical protein
VSFDRAVRRSTDSEHQRRAHGDSTLGKQAEDWARAFDSFDRVSMATRSIDVDTNDGYVPGIPEIIEFVNRRTSDSGAR